MNNKALPTLTLLVCLAAGSIYAIDRKWPDASQRVVSISTVVSGHIDGTRMMPTHIYVDEGIDKLIVSDFANSRFLINRLNNGEQWKASNMPSLNRPHVLTYSPEAKKYYAVDTDNHQLISFSSFDEEMVNDTVRYSEVNGIPMGRRPHDIAYNPVDKNIYVVLSNGILRFTGSPKGIVDPAFISKNDIANSIRTNQPDIEFNVGYVRSLTIVDGILYLSNSTQGNVIQINDFDNPKTWTAKINKNQPKKYAEKGSFDKDGLILNDIEYFNGYWYATNYYAGPVSNYLGNASISKNKLIRWKTWEDFENSKWEDLSSLVHPESITYNFSKSSKSLYLAMFHSGNEEGIGSGVYEIKTGYF